MTADADDMNKNFYHVGRGDLIPRGGVNLIEKGDTYNLGSNSYRWSDLYAEVLDYDKSIDTGGKILTLIVDYTVSDVVGLLRFTGLQGDTDLFYLIEINYVMTEGINSDFYMRINSDSAGNYSRQTLTYDGSTATTSRGGGTSIDMGNVLSTSDNCYVRVYIAAATTGGRRMVDVAAKNEVSDSDAGDMTFAKWQWNNTADEITEIYFAMSTTAGTNIRIWSLR